MRTCTAIRFGTYIREEHDPVIIVAEDVDFKNGHTETVSLHPSSLSEHYRSLSRKRFVRC